MSNSFTCLVKSKLVKQKVSCTVILHPMVSVLWPSGITLDFRTSEHTEPWTVSLRLGDDNAFSDQSPITCDFFTISCDLFDLILPTICLLNLSLSCCASNNLMKNKIEYC